MKLKKLNYSASLFLASVVIVSLSSVLLTSCGKKEDQAALSSPLLSDKEKFGETKNVAVFYEDDPTQDWNYGKLYAIMVRNLLGHFNTDVSIINVDDYYSDKLNNFDAAIYIGTLYGYPLSEDFLEDVFSTDKPFMWLLWNISRFFEKEDWDAKGHLGFGIKNTKEVESFSPYLYKGQNVVRLKIRT